MTYRMMDGLGADTATVPPATIAAFMKAFMNVGGCTPAIQQNIITSVPCLAGQYMQLLAPCLDGDIPPGMTPTEFSQACVQMQKCGMFDKPGCPDMDPSPSSFPPCMPASEFKPLVDYCRQYPNWNGPDKALNTACWAISRFPNYQARIMNMAVCPSASPPPSAVPAPPVYQAPPAAPPLVYQAPPPAAPPAPPPVYQAPPVVYQAPPATPPVQSEPPESTPSSMYNPEPSSDYSDEPLPPPTEASSTTSSSMALWGLLGVAAIGAGYLIFRKK